MPTRYEIFELTTRHFMGLLNTMPKVKADLINDDFDEKLGFILGFKTKESAEHALKVLQGPACFYGDDDITYTQQFFPAAETGLDCDHYAIYVQCPRS